MSDVCGLCNAYGGWWVTMILMIFGTLSEGWTCLLRINRVFNSSE